MASAVATVTIWVITSAGCAGTDISGKPTPTDSAVAVATTDTTETPLVAGTQIFVYTPTVGDCYEKRTIASSSGQGNTQNGSANDIVLLLDCTLPHQNEVFAIVEYPLPDPKAKTWPGDEALRKFAKVDCPKAFRDYVGKEYELSKLDISFLMPTESNWPSNRKIACLVNDRSEKRLEGSARGSAR